MRIVGIDPGQTTGMCYYHEWNGQVHWKFEQLGPKPHHNLLDMRLREEEPFIVVIESFEHVGRESVLLTPVEYIGVVRRYCQEKDIPCIKQTPAQRKFWTDAKLRKVGLHQSGQKHANDALRHVLSFLVFQKGDDRWLQALK